MGGNLTGVVQKGFAEQVRADAPGLDVGAVGDAEGDGDVVALGGVVVGQGGGELGAGDDRLGDAEADDAGRGERGERHDAEEGVLEEHVGIGWFFVYVL